MIPAKRAIRSFDQLSGLFPYFGLAIVIALVWQNHHASQIVNRALVESVRQQEALRSVLWTNLLIQRATVLSLSSVTRNDPTYQQKAEAVIASVENFLPPKARQTPDEKELVKKIEGLKIILRQTTHAASSKGLHIAQSDPTTTLVDEVDALGTTLNAAESEEWYSLVEKNNSLIRDLHARQRYVHWSYGMFVFYLFVLAWVLHRKKRMELFLKQSERKMRVLADASFEGLIILSDDRIIEVNPSFESLFEITSSEAVGQQLTEFLVTTDQQPLNVHDLSGGAGAYEVRGKRSRSGNFSVEVSVKNSVVEDRTIQIVAVRDLTDKKQTESLRLEKEAAERANRAKSLFLANMSHELRTPMHGILSFSRFGIRESRAPEHESLGSYFQEIFDSGSRLMQLLDDLLDLSKLEAGKMSYSMGPANMIELCESLFAEQQAFAKERDLILSLTAPEKPIEAILDSTRISQVLRNLISNAIKFSDSRTQIMVEFREVSGWIECVVSNKGKSIPENELDAVFDKFVQSSNTKTGAGGTGLGLAICREIITSHHGSIWAANGADGRTQFIFKIPLEQLEQVAA